MLKLSNENFKELTVMQQTRPQLIKNYTRVIRVLCAKDFIKILDFTELQMILISCIRSIFYVLILAW